MSGRCIDNQLTGIQKWETKQNEILLENLGYEMKQESKS